MATHPTLERPPGPVAGAFEQREQRFAIVDWPIAPSPARGGWPRAEREVLELLIGGLSNAEIARRRGRAVRTIANQVASIFRRLAVGSRLEVYALAPRSEPGGHDPQGLAPRQRDVLAYAVLGRSNKYIGHMLGIAPSTVAAHLASAGKKLGTPSRRGLIQAFGSRRMTGAPTPAGARASEELVAAGSHAST